MYLKKLFMPLALFFSVFMLSANTNAQTALPPYVPNVLPPSPNAAVLMKFADIPVSPYTGTADVSVPIYNIQAKGLVIPISLNYHTGGIKLSEEAGWAGLGWAVNAGGMISRTIRDQDDFTGDYFNNQVPLLPGDLADSQPANASHGNSWHLNVNKYLIDFECNYFTYLKNGTVADYTNAFSTASSGQSTHDMQPDAYSFNCLGMSGKFIIRPDKTVVLEKQDNIRIQLTGGDKFIITDSNGNRYFFNDTEVGGPVSNPDKLSSWHLSKIITQQNDVITFTYAYNGYLNVPEQPMKIYRYGCNLNSTYDAPITATSYQNYVLQKIDFTNGQVQFAFDTNREDLAGGSKLNAVKIYSKGKAGLKYVKENDLYYSYFLPTGIISQKTEQERLRLDSVKEVGTGVSAKPYSFVYNNQGGAAPGKRSYGIDHWGFYNGADGNSTLVPTTSVAYEQGAVTGLPAVIQGANRDPSTIMDIFSLKQVNYPTGGSTVFEYSPNEYDYDKSINGVVEFPQMSIVTLDTLIIIDKYGNAGGTIDLKNVISGTDVNFNIAFISKINSGWPFQDRSGYGRLYFTLGSNQIDLSNGSLNCNQMACSTSLTLPAPSATPSFNWNAYVDSSIPTADFSMIHVLIQYKAYKLRVHQANGIHKELAGGLKINSITDYSANGVVSKKRVWDYGYTSNGQQYTYGRLMSMPSYVHEEVVGDFSSSSQGLACLSLVVVGSSNTSLTSAIQGNIVGYSQVTERTVDPTTNADIGKMVYSFYNSPDSTIFYNSFRMPGTLNMGNHLNGSMLSKTVYRNTGGTYFKVNQTDNYFRTANRVVYFIPNYMLSQPANINTNFTGFCNGQQGTVLRIWGFYYPLIKSERVLQDSTREIIYDQNDTTRYVTTVSKNFYDNPVHYQVTRSSVIDKKGNLHVSRITYPQDYITSGTTTGNIMLDTLIRRNMVETAIEKRDSLYYKGSSTGYVTGASVSRYRQLPSGTVVADRQYKLDVIKPVNDFVPMSISGNSINQDSRYRQLINLDAYDDKNNIAQYTVNWQLPVSIIWDYRQQSPIAQVKNADTTAIAYTSFEAEGTGHWSVGSTQRDSVTAAFSGYKSYNLANGNITKGGLVAPNTYTVSYWTTNPAALSITSTISGYPLKGATIKGWTYYEHQVTGQATITVSGTGNIDELRLYPNGAQMVTYTYKPLVGVSGSVDVKNNPTYYEYDGLGRLQNIKDQYGNIVKSLDYNYRPQ